LQEALAHAEELAALCPPSEVVVDESSVARDVADPLSGELSWFPIGWTESPARPLSSRTLSR
jgi:hypothetical protein